MEGESVDYGRIEELANEAGEVALNKNPGDTDWGFYAWGDAPGGIGGGVGGFYWFSDEEAMADFIKNYSLFMNPPRSNLNFEEIIHATSDVVDQYTKRLIEKEDLLRLLNKNLQNASQFDWVGTFLELKNGSGSFAQNVLEDFRENNQATPVSKHEEESFREYLSMYGV